jgi:apolipoprotein N-acyltransferase
LHPGAFKNGFFVDYFNYYRKENPNTTFVIGSEFYNSQDKRFNGIATLTKNENLFRTKKKYVPIREFTPSFLQSFFPSYYVKNNKDDEDSIISSLKIFPLVCYESIFSSFVASKSSNVGALFLLTSERFMNGSRYGKNQYLNIVRLRAIETNKSILKVADDGLSCVIATNGSIELFLKKEVEQIQLKIYPSQSVYSKIVNLL